MTHPNERYKLEEFSFSPHAKRKNGGGGHIGAHTLSSPSKKLKFSEKLSFWENYHFGILRVEVVIWRYRTAKWLTIQGGQQIWRKKRVAYNGCEVGNYSEEHIC